MVINELRVKIDRPVEQVFAFVDDDDKLREWVEGIVESTRDPGPTGPGTKFRQVISVQGRSIVLDGVLTSYEPNKQIGVSLTTDSCEMNVMYKFEREGQQTVIDYRCESVYHGFFYRLMGPILKLVAQQKLKADISRLKSLVEGNGAASSAAATPAVSK